MQRIYAIAIKPECSQGSAGERRAFVEGRNYKDARCGLADELGCLLVSDRKVREFLDDCECTIIVGGRRKMLDEAKWYEKNAKPNSGAGAHYRKVAKTIREEVG